MTNEANEAYAKQVWDSITSQNPKQIWDYTYLLQFPEELWETIAKDMSIAWTCKQIGALQCGRESVEGCSRCQTREDNLREGIVDEFGQYKGDPNFGQEPKLNSDRMTVAFAGNATDFEHNHNDKHTPIVEDLAMPTPLEGMQAWGKDYVVLPDGRHGPTKASLARRKDKTDYMRKTGHQEKGEYVR